jgi:hypothetical protein
MLALLRDQDLRMGKQGKARAHYEKAYPALLIGPSRQLTEQITD